MTTLNDLTIKHPYYCSESNYYSNKPQKTWSTMREFLNEFEDADEDMNLVFRWDVYYTEENGKCEGEVFIIHQRKGIFAPHKIKSIEESDVERFCIFLGKHLLKLRELWEPLTML